MGVGVLSLIIAFIAYGRGEHPQLFWGALLQNSAFFLLVVNASMFFICATTLAMGGWQMSFRRVSEAISTAVAPIGIITGIVTLCLVFIPGTHIYHWLHPDGDPILEGKKAFECAFLFHLDCIDHCTMVCIGPQNASTVPLTG